MISTFEARKAWAHLRWLRELTPLSATTLTALHKVVLSKPNTPTTKFIVDRLSKLMVGETATKARHDSVKARLLALAEATVLCSALANDRVDLIVSDIDTIVASLGVSSLARNFAIDAFYASPLEVPYMTRDVGYHWAEAHALLMTGWSPP